MGKFIDATSKGGAAEAMDLTFFTVTASPQVDSRIGGMGYVGKTGGRTWDAP
jgi:hypothetical protein